ncbi:unnamed protein product, partial [Symbiodinium natans]
MPDAQINGCADSAYSNLCGCQSAQFDVQAAEQERAQMVVAQECCPPEALEHENNRCTLTLEWPISSMRMRRSCFWQLRCLHAFLQHGLGRPLRRAGEHHCLKEWLLERLLEAGPQTLPRSLGRRSLP